MKISTYLLVITLFVSNSTFAAKSVEQNEDLSLLASCLALTVESEQKSSIPCNYYILGFLASPRASADSIENKPGGKDRKSYGFMSRISSVRVPNPPVAYTPFCVPGDESDTRVIQVVSKQLSPEINTQKMLRDTIFKTLKSEYPC